MTDILDVPTKLTHADYLKRADDERYELLDGVLVKPPSPKEIHQYILGRLFLRLGTFIYGRNLGRVYCSPFDVVLSDTDVVQPDLLFVSNSRESIVTAENVRGAPDLVVDILSPATSERDRTIKLDLYAQHGVREYWIVDPDDRKITVFLRGESRFEVVGICEVEESLHSPTLAEFSIALREIF